MKALVYHGPGQRSWDTVDDPRIVEPTDAVVRIDSSTICGSDLHILKGDVVVRACSSAISGCLMKRTASPIGERIILRERDRSIEIAQGVGRSLHQGEGPATPRQRPCVLTAAEDRRELLERLAGPSTHHEGPASRKRLFARCGRAGDRPVEQLAALHVTGHQPELTVVNELDRGRLPVGNTGVWKLRTDRKLCQGLEEPHLQLVGRSDDADGNRIG
jgi:hypothetical protein